MPAPVNGGSTGYGAWLPSWDLPDIYSPAELARDLAAEAGKTARDVAHDAADAAKVVAPAAADEAGKTARTGVIVAGVAGVLGLGILAQATGVVDFKKLLR